MKTIKTFVIALVLGLVGVVYAANRSAESCDLNQADCCVAGASCCAGGSCCTTHEAQ